MMVLVRVIKVMALTPWMSSLVLVFSLFQFRMSVYFSFACYVMFDGECFDLMHVFMIM
jgi:hypothetical protein